MSIKPVVLFYNLASIDSDRKGLPFIQAARHLGFKTIVATHSAETSMLCGDVNEIIPLEKAGRLRELVAQHSVDFMMTVNSRLTPLVAEASKGCSIANFPTEAAVVLSHKDRYAGAVGDSGLKVPRHWNIKANSDWGLIPASLPVILKPAFSTGAVDTIRFSSAEELRELLKSAGLWCQSLKRQIHLEDFYRINSHGEYFGRFLVQEHIAYKKQMGLELLIVDGKLHLVHSAQILTTPPDYIKAYAHVGPAKVPQIILDSFQKLVTSLQLKNCHMTPDFLVDANDDWYLIDANLNLGGEGLINAIEARGLNYPLESLKAFLALPYSLETRTCYSGSVAKPSFDAASEFTVKTADSFEDLCRAVEASPV